MSRGTCNVMPVLPLDHPEPFPHPDDIEIDTRTGQVLIKGPMTREEKDRLDRLRKRKADFELQLAEFRQELIDDPDHEYRRLIEDEIAHTERVLGIIRRVIPD